MPILSEYARKRKIKQFLKAIPRNAQILEVGCGSGWALQYLRSGGWRHCYGLDLRPPADYVGDIRQWRQLGLRGESLDVILAFEVVEHVDCFRECYELLRPGGRLLLTTPRPGADWLLKVLEWCGLSQRRTSPHDRLVDLGTVGQFERKQVWLVGLLSQWAVFQKLPRPQVPAPPMLSPAETVGSWEEALV
ncbi:MAG: methyltransferase domain-containing protein [Thermoguttaceae bacterium]|jgi:2-polyprenyl-3-methyl-5-hydroxy-6-metoxy-1,4-benzoquinol methylase